MDGWPRFADAETVAQQLESSGFHQCGFRLEKQVACLGGCAVGGCGCGFFFREERERPYRRAVGVELGGCDSHPVRNAPSEDAEELLHFGFDGYDMDVFEIPAKSCAEHCQVCDGVEFQHY